MQKILHTVIFHLIFILSMVVSPAGATVAMPEFSLSSVVDGTPITSDSYKEKVLLVTFFATWCKPCMQEVVILKQLQSDLGPRGFSVVALSIDEAGPGIVSKLVKIRQINYPVAMATRAIIHDFGDFSGIPTSFLVNRQGHVVRSYTGFISPKRITQDIKALLSTVVSGKGVE